MRARSREQRAGREAVDLRDCQAGVGDGALGGVDRDRTEGLGRVPLHRALRVADDRDLVARREPRGHRATNTNAGTATPGAMILERGAHAVTEVQLYVRAVEQPTDHAEVGLVVELHVDEHERHVGGEPGEERLAHDGPGSDRAATADRLEDERGVGALAVRAHHVDRDGERAATRTARHGELVVRRGLPERCRRVVRYRYRSHRHFSHWLGHGMTPAAWSSPICSHV